MKKQYIYLIVSIFAFILFYKVLINEQIKNTIGYNICSIEEIENMEATLRKVNKEETGSLLFNEVKVPYYSYPGIYYLPVNVNEDWLWKYSFTTENKSMKIYWSEDPYWFDIETAIEISHPFSFFVTDGNIGTKGNIIFTGLPMLVLDELEEFGEEKKFASMKIFDPFSSDDYGYQIHENFVICELRGSTSRIFPKKAYNLTLCDERRKPLKKSLLGMRSDDEWKLNSLYSDTSKIREKICIDLWNEIAASTETPYDAGTKMEYLEIIIDEEYCGLYGLMEPIDYKQLSLNKEEDVLYKATTWPDRGNKDLTSLYKGAQEYCGQTIKTAGRTITRKLWNPMCEYVEMTGIKNQETIDNDALKYITEYMDMDNFLAVDFFIQAMRATDNLYKNQYVVADIQKNGEYKLWRVPWDLNFSLGDRFTEEERDLTWFDESSATEILKDHLLSEKLLDFGNVDFIDTVNQKWKKLRNGILSPTNVQRIAYQQNTILIKSGAYNRDSVYWYKEYREIEVDDILRWYNMRMECLDIHYNSYINTYEVNE